MKIYEVEAKTIPPVPPEKARLDALKRQQKSIAKTIKTTKAQEKIAQGRRQLSQALQN